MLQACYPVEVGSSSFTWADRSNSTTQMELDLAQRQAEAVSKLYARLNIHAPDMTATESAGAAVAQSAALRVQRRLGETNYAVFDSVCFSFIHRTSLVASYAGSPGSSDHSAATFGNLGTSLVQTVKVQSQNCKAQSFSDRG